MPIETAIYANLLRPAKSLNEYDAEAQDLRMNALRGQAAEQALSLGRMKQQEYMRGVEDDKALRSVVSSFTDDHQANLAALLKSGRLSEATSYQKAIDESKKAQAAAGKDATQSKGYELDQRIKGFEFMAQRLSTVNSPDDMAAWASQGVQAGTFSEAEAGNVITALQNARTPQDFARLKDNLLRAGMSATEQLKAQLDAAKMAEQSRQFGVTTDTQRRGQDMSAATQRRGQNMVDARSRESTAATLSKPFEVTGPDGTPVLVQQDKAGNIRQVPGYAPKSGTDKPLNDGQAKALAFAARMQAADNIIQGLAERGVSVSVPGSRAPIIGGAINAMSPGSRQQLDQAKRDFINAVLRRESGEVISDAEFDNAEKQYFPQIGEGDAVKKQKADNRRIALQGMKADVPKAYMTKIDEIAGKHYGGEAPPAQAPDDITDLLKKYGGR